MDAKEIAEKISRYTLRQYDNGESHALAVDYLRLRAENEALKAKHEAIVVQCLGLQSAAIGMEDFITQIADLTRQRDEVYASLEQFRRWLAEEISAAGADVGISDEPITTCLTIAKGRIGVLTTRAEAAETRASMLEYQTANAHARADVMQRQIAAMRGTLEHIAKSELMGIQYARRIALFALQPALDKS